MTISSPCCPTRPVSAARATGSTGSPSHTATSTVSPTIRGSISTGPAAYLHALVTSSLTTSCVTSLARWDTTRPCSACTPGEEVRCQVTSLADAGAVAVQGERGSYVLLVSSGTALTHGH
ncbi:hypothetical protein SHO565_78240 [Streptomyces sp. HO565]